MIKLILDGQQATFSTALIWSALSISLAVIIGFYLLRSFALFTMAKRKGLDKAYIAFIPCLWIFTACKLVGKVRLFGTTFERLALFFCIVFAVGESLNFIYNFLVYFPLVGNFLAGREIFIVMVTDSTVGVEVYTQGMTRLSGNIYGYNLVNPYTNMGISLATINTICDIIYYITSLTDIAILVITITLYINLFRIYIPNHYILFSVLAILFGLFAPLIFALRKKQPINYNDYLRSRYNAWYANGNPYGGQAPNGAPQAPSTPFEEFAERGEVDPGDPFANLGGKSSNDDSDDFFN